LRYNVLLHPKAADFLRKTDAKLRERIKRTLRELEESPERRGVRLSHSPFYRLRIGDYRAIYTINSEERKVIVLFIGHREEVYDDFSRLFSL